jgi:hypothetical protein
MTEPGFGSWERPFFGASIDDFDAAQVVLADNLLARD